jgi:hypothetical protein
MAETYPAIQTAADGEGPTIYFADEAGIRFVGDERLPTQAVTQGAKGYRGGWRPSDGASPPGGLPDPVLLAACSTVTCSVRLYARLAGRAICVPRSPQPGVDSAGPRGRHGSRRTPEARRRAY